MNGFTTKHEEKNECMVDLSRKSSKVISNTWGSPQPLSAEHKFGQSLDLRSQRFSTNFFQICAPLHW